VHGDDRAKDKNGKSHALQVADFFPRAMRLPIDKMPVTIMASTIKNWRPDTGCVESWKKIKTGSAACVRSRANKAASSSLTRDFFLIIIQETTTNEKANTDSNTSRLAVILSSVRTYLSMNLMPRYSRTSF
jgi:hypothetical protein